MSLPKPPADVRSAHSCIGLEDFYAVPGSSQYMFMPTRELWPSESVNGILPPVRMRYKLNGKFVMLKPASRLRQHRRVEQIT